MGEAAGIITLTVVGLWIAYLVPHELRRRHQLLVSRTDDRFSEALRVVAVTGRPRDAERTAGGCRDVAVIEHRARLHPELVARSEGTVDRPHGTQERIGADAARRVAAERAARAATVARRGAAARRRAGLAAALLLATGAGWTVFGLMPVSVLVGVVPSVLLAGVLVLGRRAVIAGRAADVAWRRREAELIGTAGAHATTATGEQTVVDGPAVATVTGHAVPASDEDTQVMSSAELRGRTDAGSPAPARTEHAESWSPVPVPRPTYAMKPTAPRREPAPLEVDASTTQAPAWARTGARFVTEPAAAVEPELGPEPVLEPPAETTGSLDLDAILARRRASGL